MTRLLIDGDVVSYQAAAGSEIPVNWGDGEWSLHAHEDTCKTKIDGIIQSLVESLQEQVSDAVEPVVFISGKKNFRKDVASYYKANRADTRVPMLRSFADQYLIDEYGATFEDRLEGDDMLGIYQAEDTVIWTIDKDLRMIEGKHLDDKTRELVEVNYDEGRRFYYMQILAGDPVDNYKGCPSIGMVTAAKIVDKALEAGDDIWKVIKDTFLKKGLGEEMVWENAKMARILTAKDYNFETQEVYFNGESI